jgi:hypothetical protein
MCDFNLKEGDYFQVTSLKYGFDKSFRENLFKVLSISNGIVLAERYELVLSPSKVTFPIDEWEMRKACDCFVKKYLEKSNNCCAGLSNDN